MNTYFNIIVFVLTTMAYFMAFQPKLLVETLNNPEQQAKYTKNSHFMLIVYFVFIVMFQFAINTSILASQCGGSLTLNLGTSFLLTFLPWTLIFGLVIIVLVVFPYFKSVFSDVVGYFIIANSANTLLNELLINPTVQNQIDSLSGSDPSGSDNNTNISSSLSESELNAPVPELEKIIGGASQKEYQETADVILKLFGNMSILINQIVPSNFLSYWDILKPLMKEKYQNENSDTINLKQKLLDIVVTRDNIGEGFWYGYTAVFLISLVQYYIISRGCVKNTQQMQDNYKQFLADEQKAKEQQNNVKTTYTLSS
jgi:hypothetical protein